MTPTMVSSPVVTFFVKVILPIVAMIGVFLAIHFMLFGVGDPSIVTPPTAFRAPAVFTTMGLAVFIVWRVSCIVVVELSNEGLLISSYMATISVPFDNMKKVVVAGPLPLIKGMLYLGIEFREPVQQLRYSRFSGRQIRLIAGGPFTEVSDQSVLHELRLRVPQRNYPEDIRDAMIDFIKMRN